VRQTNRDFVAHWTLPHEGNYSYWFTTEDFWENGSRMPVDSNFTFYTRALQTSDPFRLHSSALILFVRPNPFNASTTRERDLFSAGADGEVCGTGEDGGDEIKC
jgi:hypothetical protein